MRSQICPGTSPEPGTLPVHGKTRGSGTEAGTPWANTIIHAPSPPSPVSWGQQGVGKSLEVCGLYSFLHPSFIRVAGPVLGSMRNQGK